MNITYAQDTSVPVEKSRAEIEGTLARYGASRFGYMTDERQAMIGFVMNGKAIKFVLPLPNPNADEFTVQVFTYRGRETSRQPRSPEARANSGNRRAGPAGVRLPFASRRSSRRARPGSPISRPSSSPISSRPADRRSANA